MSDIETWMDSLEEEISIQEDSVKIHKLTRDLKSSRKKNKELVSILEESKAREKILLSLDNFENEVKPINAWEKSAVAEATAVALASDWHVEELIDPATINNLNKYNLEIAEKRARNFFKALLWKVRSARHGESPEYGYKIDNLVLWLGGDMISGYIHEELMESNLLSPIQAILFCSGLIQTGINFLLEEGGFKRILVPCSVGNHGRTSPKRKISTGAANSFEWLMYHQLRQVYENESRVEFKIAEGPHLYLEIYDWTFRFHHGDDVKGGVNLAVPLRKAVDSWNIGKYADVTCFPPGTPILDSNYCFLPIEDLQNDQTISGREGTCIIEQVHSPREYKGNLFQFQIEGIPNFIQGTTPEHPFWVSEDMTCVLPSKSIRCHPDKITNSKPCSTCKKQVEPKPKWKEAKNVKPGDFVSFPVPKIPPHAIHSPELARLLGYYLAEGSIHRNDKKEPSGIIFTFHEKEHSFHEDVMSIVQKELEKEAKFRSRKADTSAIDIRFYSKKHAPWFLEHGGCYCDKKKLSSWAWTLDAESRRNLLIGWLRGDGFSRKERPEIVGVTTSRNLAVQLFFLSLSLKYRPTLRKVTPSKENRKEYYCLSFYGRDTEELAPYLNKNIPPKRNWTKTHGFFHDGLYFARVKSVTEIPYEGPVHNMRTSTREYVAGLTLVHNCIGHYHQFLDENFAVVNGSLCGYNAFAQSIKARYEPPRQAFFLVDKERGKIDVSPLYVDGEQRRMPSGRVVSGLSVK